MIKRVVAAVVALVLAALAAVLITGYASRADERALAGMETVQTVVVAEEIAEGTPLEDAVDLMEVRDVPLQFLVAGAVEDVEELAGLAATDLIPGQQVTPMHFVTEEALRAQGAFVLPDEAKDLHQVTVPLDNPRALGGNIAPGDTVGVFISIEGTNADPEDVADVADDQDTTAGTESGSDGGSVSMTHLTLHKVLVVRVEGGYVSTPDGGEESATEGVEGPRDVIHVTLALEAPDAETLVFGMEWGTVWLSLEPEGADEEGTEVVVVTVPRQWRDVYE